MPSVADCGVIDSSYWLVVFLNFLCVPWSQGLLSAVTSRSVVLFLMLVVFVTFANWSAVDLLRDCCIGPSRGSLADHVLAALPCPDSDRLLLEWLCWLLDCSACR